LIRLITLIDIVRFRGLLPIESYNSIICISRRDIIYNYNNKK
jgi:hypothetical protein